MFTTLGVALVIGAFGLLILDITGGTTHLDD